MPKAIELFLFPFVPGFLTGHDQVVGDRTGGEERGIRTDNHTGRKRKGKPSDDFSSEKEDRQEHQQGCP